MVDVDGLYNHLFVQSFPDLSTVAINMLVKSTENWTPKDVLSCLISLAWGTIYHYPQNLEKNGHVYHIL